MLKPAGENPVPGVERGLGLEIYINQSKRGKKSRIV
jgi:hypothetical protein